MDAALPAAVLFVSQTFWPPSTATPAGWLRPPPETVSPVTAAPLEWTAPSCEVPLLAIQTLFEESTAMASADGGTAVEN
jgi:hypothetical protein